MQRPSPAGEGKSGKPSNTNINAINGIAALLFVFLLKVNFFCVIRLFPQFASLCL